MKVASEQLKVSQTEKDLGVKSSTVCSSSVLVSEVKKRGKEEKTKKNKKIKQPRKKRRHVEPKRIVLAPYEDNGGEGKGKGGEEGVEGNTENNKGIDTCGSDAFSSENNAFPSSSSSSSQSSSSPSFSFSSSSSSSISSSPSHSSSSSSSYPTPVTFTTLAPLSLSPCPSSPSSSSLHPKIMQTRAARRHLSQLVSELAAETCFSFAESENVDSESKDKEGGVSERGAKAEREGVGSVNYWNVNLTKEATLKSAVMCLR